MNAVPSRFHQSDYTLSFGGPTSVIGPFFNLSSESDSIITQLGFVKMSPFDLDWKPVHLELNGLLFNHDLHQLQTLINFVATAGIGRLVSSFSSFLSLYEEAERKVSSRINKFDKNVFHRYFDNSRQYISNMVSGYSIVMHGKPKANIFGILFRGIDVSYTLPLRFGMCIS